MSFLVTERLRRGQAAGVQNLIQDDSGRTSAPAHDVTKTGSPSATGSIPTVSTNNFVVLL